MNLPAPFSNKILFSGIAGLLVFIHVLWDYFHGGVPTHYFLADENMPGFSNWWGCVTIPILSWICISLMEKMGNPDKVKSGFLGGLIFGIIISLLWKFDQEAILPYIMLLPFFLALFIPVHLPQHFLGFVLAMPYSFGGVLPIVIGSVLLLGAFIIYTIRQFVLRLFSKNQSST